MSIGDTSFKDMSVTDFLAWTMDRLQKSMGSTLEQIKTSSGHAASQDGADSSDLRCEPDEFIASRYDWATWQTCRPSGSTSEVKTVVESREKLTIEDISEGFKFLGRSLLAFGGETKHLLWDSQPEGMINFVKLSGRFLAAYLTPPEPEEQANRWEINQGVIQAALHFRGKDYRFRATDDGMISVNGKKWKLEGTTAETKMASVELESMSFDPDAETLKVEIKGSLLFVTKKIEKTLAGDQVEQILKALTESEGPITTPEMKANGIRLVPA